MAGYDTVRTSDPTVTVCPVGGDAYEPARGYGWVLFVGAAQYGHQIRQG